MSILQFIIGFGVLGALISLTIGILEPWESQHNFIFVWGGLGLMLFILLLEGGAIK